jgi:hypothetical protein
MAEIRLHHKHACSRPEARERLEPHIREIAQAYSLRTKWIEDVCYFDGPARGYLKVMEGSILLLANFTPTARLFKASIEQGICNTLDRALR